MQRYFPIPFVLFLTLSSVLSLVQMFNQQPLLSWLGVFITSLPMLGFFIWISVCNVARSSRHLNLQMLAIMLGLALSLACYTSFTPLLLSMLASLGTVYYVYVYTALDRSKSQIKIGQALAPFSLMNLNAESVSSQHNHDRYRLWLFIRANWCPLCVAQVKELAAQYRRLESLNCDIYIISSQAQKESQKLARKLQAPLQFLVDENNQAAQTLGIEHIGGTPFGMAGYAADTAMPTAIISAPDNTIIFADQTDDYRLRPEPDTFIQAIERHLTA